MPKNIIEQLEEKVKEPKSLLLFRIKHLDNDGAGLAATFLPYLREITDDWIRLLKNSNGSIYSSLESADETLLMRRALFVCQRISEEDHALNEELGHEGFHALLSKIIKIDPSNFAFEADRDTLMSLQDLSCEIASTSPSFPMRVAHFTHEELTERLPLKFHIRHVDCAETEEHIAIPNDADNEVLIFINQVKERQSSQADVGFIMWPSAVVLSRWLVTNPDVLKGKDVLELGAGCGLTGLVAGQLKVRQSKGIERDTQQHQTTVTMTDFNPKVVQNCEQNINLNGLRGFAKSEGLDFYKQELSVNGWIDSSGVIRDQADLILAADIICQVEDAFAAARTIYCSLVPGGQALVVSADSEHRFGVEKFEEACQELGLEVSKKNVRDLYGGALLANNMEKTTGYVDHMNLTMYTVDKVR